MPDPAVWGRERWSRHLLVAHAADESGEAEIRAAALTYFRLETLFNPCPACQMAYSCVFEVYEPQLVSFSTDTGHSDFTGFVLAARRFVDDKCALLKDGSFHPRITAHADMRKRLATFGFNISHRQALLQCLMDTHVGTRMEEGPVLALRLVRAFATCASYAEPGLAAALHASLDSTLAAVSRKESVTFDVAWRTVFRSGTSLGAWSRRDTESSVRAAVLHKMHEGQVDWAARTMV